MRKKIVMRKSSGKTAKFAEGGSVRGRGISQGLRSDRASQPRVQEAERAMNASTTRRFASDEEQSGDRPMASASVPDTVVTAPRSTSAPRRRASGGRRTSSADDLNERELTRILNDRSLESAREGRNMYKKGGRVMAKKGK